MLSLNNTTLLFKQTLYEASAILKATSEQSFRLICGVPLATKEIKPTYVCMYVCMYLFIY
jgi:hypothetical protein